MKINSLHGDSPFLSNSLQTKNTSHWLLETANTFIILETSNFKSILLLFQYAFVNAFIN